MQNVFNVSVIVIFLWRIDQGRRPSPGETAVLTPEMEQKQLEKYKIAFEAFKKYKNLVTGVTFCNVSGRYSWLDTRGRKSFPLLFDAALTPKKAYWAVMNFYM